jgi:hypothetical protein
MFIQQDFFNVFFGWILNKGQEPAPMPFSEPVALSKPATSLKLAI